MIECKECNKFFKILTNSHLLKHGMTPEEYKIKHNVETLIPLELSEKLSKMRTGSNNPCFGKKQSKYTKNKISEKLKEHYEKNDNPFLGKKHSEETKSIIGDKAKQRFKSGEQVPFFKGISIRDETKEKLSKQAKERYKNLTQEQLDARSLRGKRQYKERFKDGNNLCDYVPEETKRINGERGVKFLQLANQKKTNEANLNRYEIAENMGFSILEIENRSISFKCNKCSKIFIRDIQTFHNSKIKVKNDDECLYCIPKNKSKSELEIYNKLIKHGFVTTDRTIIYPYEVDMINHEMKLAIEYCGLYWHSELRGKYKSYHYDKMKLLADKGYRLITIFEDEYVDNPELVMSMINAKIGIIENKIFARKTEVRSISSKMANVFLNEHHIQGAGRSNVCIGLYYNEELVSVMTFLKGEITRKNKKDWEINRYCNKMNTTIVGGASKLFKYFLKEFSPQEVISYADRRWGSGDVYINLDFKNVSETVPNYWYIKYNTTPLKRYHRFSLRKNDQDNPELTEWENRVNQGWDRIWDCGSFKYIWKSDN